MQTQAGLKLVKLHRSRHHSIVAGVMGGIAEYLGWSPMLTRIIFFVVSSLSAGVPGLVIYIVLWIVMPKATEASYVQTRR